MLFAHADWLARRGLAKNYSPPSSRRKTKWLPVSNNVTLKQVKLLFGPIVIQLVWHIIKLLRSLVRFPNFCNSWIKIRTKHFLYCNLFITYVSSVFRSDCQSNPIQNGDWLYFSHVKKAIRDADWTYRFLHMWNINTELYSPPLR